MHKAQISKSVFNQFLTGGDRYAFATKNMQIFIKMELSLSRKDRYSKNKSSKSFIFSGILIPYRKIEALLFLQSLAWQYVATFFVASLFNYLRKQEKRPLLV